MYLIQYICHIPIIVRKNFLTKFNFLIFSLLEKGYKYELVILIEMDAE